MPQSTSKCHSERYNTICYIADLNRVFIASYVFLSGTFYCPLCKLKKGTPRPKRRASIQANSYDDVFETETPTPKRRRGRPPKDGNALYRAMERKSSLQDVVDVSSSARKRGRPRKLIIDEPDPIPLARHLPLSPKKQAQQRRPDPLKTLSTAMAVILTPSEADTSHTKPQSSDVVSYQKAVQKASADRGEANHPFFMLHRQTLSQPSIFAPHLQTIKMNAAQLTLLAEQIPPRIKKIIFNGFEIETWYNAPYPEEYLSEQGNLWICDRCFKYVKSKNSLCRHLVKCPVLHPPGDEIYRDGNISVFEVNGRKNKVCP